MKLTKSKVEGLPVPETGQALHWDEELRGFGLRITPSGARSYIVQGRVAGKTRRVTIGAHGRLTCDEARKKARVALISMDDGIDPQQEKKSKLAQAITLRDVATDYCKNRQTKKGGKLKASSVADIEYHIQKTFGDWADSPIINITTEMCRDRFEEASKKSPAQANQAFRVLRALINFSIDEENPRLNPVATLSKKRLWNRIAPRESRIPNEQIGRVWNMLMSRRGNEGVLTAGQTGADIVAFLLLTGSRWSEAAELTWDRVDLEKNTWHLPYPKNHNPVTLPLSTPLQAMLAARPRIEGNNYVFFARSKVGSLKDARFTMTEVSKLAGQHLSPHDLRRTFIAMGIRNKIEMWKLKLLTNHISEGDVTLDHYTEKSDLTYLAGEAEQIAKWVIEQAAIAAADNVVQLNKAA